jgi:hypothetical protein
MTFDSILVRRRSPSPGLECVGWGIAGGGSGLPRVVVQSTVQVGGPTPKAGGRQLDGRTWDQMPSLAGST